jgi:hypothetical protein
LCLALPLELWPQLFFALVIFQIRTFILALGQPCPVCAITLTEDSSFVLLIKKADVNVF